MSRWRLLPFLLLAACRGSSSRDVDAGVQVPVMQVEGPDGGLMPARVAAWLSYQAELAKLPPVGKGDGGAAFLRDEVRGLARAEESLRLDAGLRGEALDQVEDVIAAVVAQRAIGRITGADALKEFERASAELKDAQRAQALKALGELKARAQAGAALPDVRAKYGDEAVDAVLAREEDVTKAWEALLEGRAKR